MNNLEDIKTLAMLKMEKNFIGHIEKGYHRQPYNHYDLPFWLERIRQETEELSQAITNNDFSNVKDELADISNLVDYAFERVLINEKFAEKHPIPLVLSLDHSGLDQLFKENKDLPKNRDVKQ